MVLEVDHGLKLEELVILPCQFCGHPTPHSLSKLQTMYVCGCGECIDIERTEEE